VSGFCEYGNEPWGSIKKGYFLTHFMTISFLNNVLHHGVWSKYINPFSGTYLIFLMEPV
jgi:hypothetical protein